ncbi:hypothetical protein UG55_103530 [Frankia sp. EI5c]|uniref:hypothetical protein n=1 Tax=Frankia sp. EI5c TaxID=683316 RepID=UPI0007C2CA0C|nr:hypothetical protein [Frankia sp. EI5c]OAA23596.1 hypothetical protein UG55_103530 [Frankia sp. EI5c]
MIDQLATPTDPIHPVAARTAERAAATVGRYALDETDRDELLAMLGLPLTSIYEGQAHAVEPGVEPGVGTGYLALAAAVLAPGDEEVRP